MTDADAIYALCSDNSYPSLFNLRYRKPKVVRRLRGNLLTEAEECIGFVDMLDIGGVSLKPRVAMLKADTGEAAFGNYHVTCHAREKAADQYKNAVLKGLGDAPGLAMHGEHGTFDPRSMATTSSPSTCLDSATLSRCMVWLTLSFSCGLHAHVLCSLESLTRAMDASRTWSRPQSVLASC